VPSGFVAILQACGFDRQGTGLEEKAARHRSRAWIAQVCRHQKTCRIHFVLADQSGAVVVQSFAAGDGWHARFVDRDNGFVDLVERPGAFPCLNEPEGFASQLVSDSNDLLMEVDRYAKGPPVDLRTFLLPCRLRHAPYVRSIGR
jgi:hypothetical protein